LYQIDHTVSSSIICTDALSQLDGHIDDEIYCYKEQFVTTFKLVISLLEIVKSERDQIEFVDPLGEPVYIYRPIDLDYFVGQALLGNPHSQGIKFIRIAVFDTDPLDGDEPDSFIWRRQP
jgi:hypothetical protein